MNITSPTITSPGPLTKLPGKGVSVLISGGSIAGPSIAWWLNKYGFTTTIVERCSELRQGGQNIDVKGIGAKIISKMGLLEAVKSHNTTEEGFRMVDSNGKAIVQIAAADGGPTQELEILRGDFSQVLYDATKDETRYLFGDCITRVDDEENGDGKTQGKAKVTFKSGREEDFDIVVIADGIRSRTRRLIFGDEVKFKTFGLSIAYATIPRIPTDTSQWSWYSMPGGRAVSTRPDPYGTTRAFLSFLSTEGYMQKDAQERIDILRQKFSGAGWETDRILAELDQTDDLYCEDLQQVKAPRYHTGRCVLLGDAGYCATPFSGQGTTLSLSGAFILASELALAPHDYQTAFKEYERHMRPIADKAQQLPPFFPQSVHPVTKTGVWVLQTVLRMVLVAVKFPWPGFIKDWAKRQNFGENQFKIPEYPALEQYL